MYTCRILKNVNLSFRRILFLWRNSSCVGCLCTWHIGDACNSFTNVGSDWKTSGELKIGVHVVVN